MDSTRVIYELDEHDQVLELWRDQRLYSLRVLHLDAHCDMRGILIDRKGQCVYNIGNTNKTVDPGNFLAQAIVEGRISSLQWVYDELGGRRYDVGTVKYETDLTAIPYRWMQAICGKQGIPLLYQDMTFSEWSGLIEGEYLDIDWDFFASTAYQANTIQNRVDAFLATKLNAIPDQVYICYSPDFSHPSRIQYQLFVNDLARIFDAKVIELHPTPDRSMAEPFYRKYLPPALFRLARMIYYKASLGFRRWGIY
jgi:hypothetical protein